MKFYGQSQFAYFQDSVVADAYMSLLNCYYKAYFNEHSLKCMCSYLQRYFKVDKVEREENLTLKEEVIPLIQFSQAVHKSLKKFSPNLFLAANQSAAGGEKSRLEEPSEPSKAIKDPENSVLEMIEATHRNKKQFALEKKAKLQDERDLQQYLDTVSKFKHLNKYVRNRLFFEGNKKPAIKQEPNFRVEQSQDKELKQSMDKTMGFQNVAGHRRSHKTIRFVQENDDLGSSIQITKDAFHKQFNMTSEGLNSTLTPKNILRYPKYGTSLTNSNVDGRGRTEQPQTGFTGLLATIQKISVNRHASEIPKSQLAPEYKQIGRNIEIIGLIKQRAKFCKNDCLISSTSKQDKRRPRRFGSLKSPNFEGTILNTE